MREDIQSAVIRHHKQTVGEGFADYTFSQEGIATAVVADVGHSIHNQASRVLGWFEGVKKKREHINEIAESTVEWLKEEDRSNRNLNLDMGAFKTWMKTSETFIHHYYYLLADVVYNEIAADLKKGDISELERFFEHFMLQVEASRTMVSADNKDRRSATKLLDSAKTIKDLIILVEKYRGRCNVLFDLLQKQDRSIKNFPFQLILRGAADLRSSCKKIVNLAV